MSLIQYYLFQRNLKLHVFVVHIIFLLDRVVLRPLLKRKSNLMGWKTAGGRPETVRGGGRSLSLFPRPFPHVPGWEREGAMAGASHEFEDIHNDCPLTRDPASIRSHLHSCGHC